MDLDRFFCNFSPEFRLLLASISCAADTEKKAAIRQQAVQPLNWELVLQLAVQHGIYQPVYKALSSLSAETVPQWVLRELQQSCHNNAVQAVLKTNELSRLVKRLEENDVRVVALKGQALAQRLYGNIADRPTGDIDLLVWPGELAKAAALLRQEGYCQVRPGDTVPDWYRQRYFKNSHHINFQHKERKINLELHWRLGHAGMDIPLTEAANRQIVAISGDDIPVLNKETEFLFLVLHGADHGWCRLCWMYDIVKILQSDNAIDWVHTAALADRLGIRPVVHQILFLAHSLLAAPLPVNFTGTLAADGRGRQLACLAIPLLDGSDSRPLQLKCQQDMAYWWRVKLYKFRLRTGGERIRYILHHFDPPEADVKLVSLPEQLYLLYYGIRPVAWLWRRIRRTAAEQS